MLGGEQGIGKDSLLEPVKEAVGRWNFAEIIPEDLFAPFNPFARSTILRINEARDLGEVNRFKFYDRAKLYIVVPIDVLPIRSRDLGRQPGAARTDKSYFDKPIKQIAELYGQIPITRAGSGGSGSSGRSIV